MKSDLRKALGKLQDQADSPGAWDAQRLTPGEARAILDFIDELELTIKNHARAILKDKEDNGVY